MLHALRTICCTARFTTNTSVPNVPISEPLQQAPAMFAVAKSAATNIGLPGKPGEAIPFPHTVRARPQPLRTGIDIAIRGDTTDALDERSDPYHMLNRARILVGVCARKCNAPTRFGRLVEKALG